MPDAYKKRSGSISEKDREKLTESSGEKISQAGIETNSAGITTSENRSTGADSDPEEDIPLSRMKEQTLSIRPEVSVQKMIFCYSLFKLS